MQELTTTTKTQPAQQTVRVVRLTEQDAAILASMFDIVLKSAGLQAFDAVGHMRQKIASAQTEAAD